MGVSKNSGTYPQIINFNRLFHYKPSILEYHHLRKHPCPAFPNMIFVSADSLERHYRLFQAALVKEWKSAVSHGNKPSVGPKEVLKASVLSLNVAWVKNAWVENFQGFDFGQLIDYLYWGGSKQSKSMMIFEGFFWDKSALVGFLCHIMTPVFCSINARASKPMRLMVTWWKRWVRVQVLPSWECWLGDCCCIVRSFLKDAQWCWLPMMLHTKQVGFQPGMDGWQDE